MKRLLFTLALMPSLGSTAQSIDSIRFQLYTDSLKRGSYNYINVEGKSGRGRWLPLDTSAIIIRTSAGTLFGNSVWIPWDFREQKVDIRCMLRSDSAKTIDTVIYIKTTTDTTLLKTKEQMLEELQPSNKTAEDGAVRTVFG